MHSFIEGYFGDFMLVNYKQEGYFCICLFEGILEIVGIERRKRVKVSFAFVIFEGVHQLGLEPEQPACSGAVSSLSHQRRHLWHEGES